jgi:hypothetical protein
LKITAVGGLKEALSQHADQTYAELHTKEKQRVAEIMFRCLADEGPQKQVVRRIATVGKSLRWQTLTYIL